MSAVTLAVCRDCAGLGNVPYNGDWADGHAAMVKCEPCDGTGRYDEVRLRRAYEAGRRDAIEQAALYVRELEGMCHLATGSLFEPSSETGRTLRLRIGG